jgi:tetrahydromethanopterin S-methyltransferase subunit G
MARLAASEYGADWVINSDADEFWWPRGASLSDVLSAVPPRYGTVGAFLRVFCPRPGDEHFAERMTVRFSALAPINDPASLYKPIRKIVHRGHPEIQVTRGNHALVDSPFAPLRGWFPIECFHFPLRSEAQCAHKAELQGSAFERHIARPPTAYHADMFAALRSGRIGEYYEALVVSDDELERGLAEGRLVVDTRLRDALREVAAGGTPAFPLPTLVEDAEYAVEAAVLGEADVVRLQRRLDELEHRLQRVEQRLPRRAYRKLTRAAKRVVGDRAGSA